MTQRPAFAFGDGLSYTEVEYADLRVEPGDLSPTDTVHAEVTVRNTGARPVRETIQAYVSDTVTSVSWAEKELKAFRQVELRPGQSATVRIDIPVADCAIVDGRGARVVEPGAFTLLVGPSSRDETLLRAAFAVRPVA
ncbi:fibronectin type III-like domain-contianing protein [Micromonospora sp. ATCC 39149]|uniref:fibronectin type III-like domain-contianing protein n=1 Tax=Micromonospora sp. (strain ATCC 39149 / NRRL 15099 / SCC 1413) TaxID=219305 RepID=UPI001E28B39A|nr:fibronectin type III-like domain-contianing protein [Micromonospora sp. ATCC 39149]